jgi:hypothetical protein
MSRHQYGIVLLAQSHRPAGSAAVSSGCALITPLLMRRSVRIHDAFGST